MADEDDSAPLPIAAGGLVSVVSPGGTAGTVPEKDLDAAIAMGYRLEAPAAHGERRLQQEYGSSPITAAGLGAASSVTFGASDVLLDKFTKDDSGESASSEISRRNKGARMVGELGGLVTGVGAAGLISGVGKAARAAAGAGLRGAAAAGAAEGGLLGVQQTVSHVGLSDDPLTAEAVAGDLVKNVLLGGGLGAGGGALGELVGRAAGKAREGFTRLSDELGAKAAAPGEKAALAVERKAELERLAKAIEPERAALADELKVLRSDQKPLREALQSRIASAAPTVREDLVRAERSLAGIVGNPRKLAANPESALDAVVAYEQHLAAAVGTEPPKLAAGMLDRLGGIRQRLELLEGGPSSPALAKIDGRLAELAKVPEAKEGLISGIAKDAAGAAVFTAANAALGASDLPGAGLLAFLLAGKLGGRLGNVVGNRIKTRALEVGARLSSAASRVMGVAEKGARPAFARAAALSPEAFDDVRDAALEAAADPTAFKARIDQQLDGVRVHDPILADQLAEVMMRGPLHLAEVAPRAPGGPTLSDDKGAVSRIERDRFLRRTEVVLDPTTLLDALEDGTLTPSMVQTADAVHLEVMAVLRGRLLEQMKGRELSANRRLALTILLGAPATASLRPEHIAAAQARINSDIGSAARTPPPQSTRAAPREADTAGQRAAGR